MTFEDSTKTVATITTSISGSNSTKNHEGGSRALYIISLPSLSLVFSITSVGVDPFVGVCPSVSSFVGSGAGSAAATATGGGGTPDTERDSTFSCCVPADAWNCA